MQKVRFLKDLPEILLGLIIIIIVQLKNVVITTAKRYSFMNMEKMSIVGLKAK